MSDEIFDSVWDAIEDTPQEAENMRLRSTLLIALSQRIEPPARWCLLRRSGQWRHLLSRGSSASWATAAQPLRSMTAAAGAAGVAAVHLIAPAPLCGFPDGYNAVPVTDQPAVLDVLDARRQSMIQSRRLVCHDVDDATHDRTYSCDLHSNPAPEADR